MKEKNLSKKNIATSRGITLIALVITIIVMLILVAVTITIAINGGLFDYAGKATGETKNEINKEQELANGRITVDGKLYNSIDDYLAGKELRLSYDETPKDEANNGVLKATATFTDEGGTAVIPKGFKIVEGLNGSKSIAGGLVIEDKDGNQFVWIPVTGYTKDGSPDDHGLYESFKAKFTRGYSLSSSNTEPYTNGYKEEKTEYYDMMLSVQENGGFYIGRFEAGTVNPETGNQEPRTSDSVGTTKMVVKQNQYPYNYVGWGATMDDYTKDVTYNNHNYGKGALYLSKHMYDGQNVGVTPTLCYGVQWDAMCNFINDDEKHHVEGDSTSWGNYKDNAWTIDRETAKFAIYNNNNYTLGNWQNISDETNKQKTKTSSDIILLTTGASDTFAAKNIFDVAGNCYEWTMEANSSNLRVNRGRQLLLHWL